LSASSSIAQLELKHIRRACSVALSRWLKNGTCSGLLSCRGCSCLPSAFHVSYQLASRFFRLAGVCSQNCCTAARW
jgi:hypothetical protein